MFTAAVIDPGIMPIRAHRFPGVCVVVGLRGKSELREHLEPRRHGGWIEKPCVTDFRGTGPCLFVRAARVKWRSPLAAPAGL